MEFTRETSKAIRKWLKANGFSCGCRLGREFYYEPNEDYICIPRNYDNSVDCDFMQCLRGLGLTTDFDCITLSVLHELGHFMTYPNFTDDEWNSDSELKSELPSIALNDHRLNLMYWATRTEKSANEWAVSFADEFVEITTQLEDIFEETAVFQNGGF